MTVTVDLLPEPYMEASLKAGGSLTVGQDYYLIGYFSNGKGSYYGNAVSRPSKEMKIVPTSGNQTIRVDWWARQNPIDSFASASSTTTTVTSVDHGLSNGDLVHIGETANYNGDYTISNVTADTFDITKVFAVTETGVAAWQKGMPNLSTKYQGVISKWDKYSMMRADGSYYQWFNLNDPAINAATGGNEYYDVGTFGQRGHRKWTETYSATGYSGDFLEFDSESTTITPHTLMDGAAINWTVAGYMNHPEICYNRIVYPSIIGRYLTIDKGRAIIVVTGTGNTFGDIMYEFLTKERLDDMYAISNQPKASGFLGYTYATFNAHIIMEAGAELALDDVSMVLMGGALDYNSGTITIDRSKISLLGLQSLNWRTSNATLTNSEYYVAATVLALDGLTTDNVSVRGNAMKYGKTLNGMNLVGDYPFAKEYFEWRYQRMYSAPHIYASYARDLYIRDYFMQITDRTGVDSAPIGEMHDIQFLNDGYSVDYDVQIVAGSHVTADSDRSWDCHNVTSDRNDGVLRVDYNVTTSSNYTDIWRFYYGVDLKIVDAQSEVIENAQVEVIGGITSTGTTDFAGNVSLKCIGYTIEYDAADPDGFGGDTKTTLDIPFEINVYADGFDPYTLKNISTRDNISDTIKLTPLKIYIDQEQL